MSADQHEITRLQDALDAVAAHHQPDPEAWERISGRAAAPADLVAAPAPTTRPHTARRVVAAAAAVLAFGVGITVVVSTGDDDAQVTTAPEAEATGWYVPQGLPEGWEVLSATTTRMDEPCPCRTAVWANADRTQVISAVAERAPVTDDSTTIPAEDEVVFDLGDGVQASRTARLGSPTYWAVFWTADGQRQSIEATGVPIEDAEPVARAIYADRDAATIPVRGLDLVDEWTEASRVGPNATVKVALRTPAGRITDYTLSPPRNAIQFHASFRPTQRLEGQPLPILSYLPPGAPLSSTTRDYVGRWPGAMVRVLSGNGEVEGSPGASAAEADLLMASLRPATTEEWRTFVAEASNRDRSVTASATLADLVAGRGDPSNPPAAEPKGRLTDLDLTLSAEPRLASWEDANVVLTVHNPTSAAITDPRCLLDFAEIALVPADDATADRVAAIPAGEAWWQEAGDCDGGSELASGATKTIRLVVRAQFLDSRYGPLPSGSYRATARIADLEVVAPALTEIRATDCGGSTADYVGRTLDEARALAQQRGDELVVPEPGPDSESGTDVCNRVNVILDGDRVIYARAY